ncbi:ATP-binding protein [Usitatibacter palustris]|uniref:histidine kinase n=1 Tax=Usitatibacter palustris TaxID=2732487 RepID=A0A6M4H438_9PROT|nr:ATP-binding protein [Usitatibacter palustris]QJR13473.1 Sensor protein RstB [Usitatibacter palustris]
MLRLFFRLYLFLMLPATAAFVFFMYVTDQVMAQLHAEQQRARAGQAFDRAERIIGDTRVPDWQGRLKEIEATFRVEHQIVPLARAQDDWFMSSSEKDRLEGGLIAMRDRPGGGQVYMRKFRDNDRVLRIEWVGAYEYIAIYYTLIVALVTLAMSVILYRWARPLWRDVEALKAATSRVGLGDFHVRAEIAKNSMLEPIGAAFNTMAERVQALLRSHSDLEQSVAHELRTPLAQLKFDLELARSSGTPQERENRFKDMERDVVELEELVNELLLLASLREAPPYKPKQIAAKALVDEVIRRAKDEMRASGHEVAIEPPRHLPQEFSCDSKYLSRALANVVRNAVRYAKTKVILTVERSGERTIINVDDDGPGVPPESRARMFEPFARMEGSRDRETGGVGLGLAIVKSVAEWHGGEARISDSPLGGARVSISW